MVTRWAHEALCVEQFKRNRFEKPFFDKDMEISQNDWYASFLVPALKIIADEAYNNKAEDQNTIRNNFLKLDYHIHDLADIAGLKPGKWAEQLNPKDYGEYASSETKLFLDTLKTIFRQRSRAVSLERDSLYQKISGAMGQEKFVALRAANYNENLANFVLNRLTVSKIYDAGNRLVQKSDPVLMRPLSKSGRAHFYAPYKQIGNLAIDTLYFNIMVIWLMTFTLFVALYYNMLHKFIRLLESLKLPLLKKFGREFLPW
jgi:hypothetical protein